MRERRRALSNAERLRASRQLCRRLTDHPFYRRADRVGIYFPNDGEIDVTALAAGGRKKFYLPILPQTGKRLWFGYYRLGAKLVPDRFGIPEPVTASRIRIESLDLVIVPLVAFDSDGGRVGMGGGFYDTSLSFLRHRGRIAPIRIVGAADGFQQVDTIPRDSWDIPLHGIVTDERFISCTAVPNER